MSLFVLLQGLALAGMVAVSAWGWTHIDPHTRIRVRTISFDWTISKKTALVLTPLIGSAVVLATLGSDPPNRDTIEPLGLAVSIVFLLAHWSSVRRAAR